ncbi:MAG: hypothetical protein ACRC68_01975 [Clostridium sp.]
MGFGCKDDKIEKPFNVWDSIRNQVLENEQGLCLGIFAEEPKLK